MLAGATYPSASKEQGLLLPVKTGVQGSWCSWSGAEDL